ncbi:MAG: hypothetical protein HKN58_09765 [Xanthomonadales bacterium]|nr:hypothetical protein [Xanthomonadales bacterium]
MARTLHLLMSSDPRALADCLALARAGDQLLLVDRGVDLLLDTSAGALEGRVGERGLAALEADVASIGLLEHARGRGLALWSDRQWVDRVLAARHVMSWR